MAARMRRSWRVAAELLLPIDVISTRGIDPRNRIVMTCRCRSSGEL